MDTTSSLELGSPACTYIKNHKQTTERQTSIPSTGFFVLENFSSSIHSPASARARILNHQYLVRTNEPQW